jgi:tetratricopeptide (TPR) repeat protein
VDEAIVHYQRALTINPNFAEAHNNMGDAFLQQGRMDEAIAQLQRALAINPNYTEARYNLGNAFRRQGKENEAIAQFQKALAINPEFAEAHYNLGNAFLQQGHVDEAIGHFQKALDIKPDYVEARNNLAYVLATCPQASLRNGFKAVGLAERANQLAGGKNPVILATLAAAYAEAGRFPEAIETAQRALRLAEAQSNTTLAGALQSQLKLYQAGIPFHGTEQAP